MCKISFESFIKGKYRKKKALTLNSQPFYPCTIFTTHITFMNTENSS